MSWTKGEFVNAAFSEIGLGSYEFDLQAEQLEDALHKLDAMMATWDARGLRLGYPLPATPSVSTLSELSNVPDLANEAIFLNLAIRLGPTMGKTVSQETKQTARNAYMALLATATQPENMQLPKYLPSGAGNKGWRYADRTFLNQPSDPLDVGPDGELEFNP